MRAILSAVLLPALLVACTPTVKLEAPDKPIEINMNVKIEHEVRVSIAKDVREAISKDPSLF
jgi:hypothetical protein